MEFKTKSPKQTQKIAADLAKTLKGGEVIALFGDLGSGKTVFVQGLAKALGIKNRITSPTFVFIKSYSFNLNNKLFTLYHLDLYRGQTLTDFDMLGLSEFFSPDSIVVIEWAQKIKESLPKNRISIFFEVIDENTRSIKIDRRL